MTVNHSEFESAPVAAINLPAASGSLFLSQHKSSNSQSMAAANASDLSITVKNGIATLSGSTGSTAETNMVEYLVSRMKGVEQVINLITD